MFESLKAIEQYEKMTLDNFINNFEAQLIVQRGLEILINFSSEIIIYLLSALYLIELQRREAHFIVAFEQKILTKQLAQQLTNLAKLSVVLDKYMNINDKIIYQAISKALVYYPKFIQEINIFLDSLEAHNG